MPEIRPTVPRDVPAILALIGEVFREYDCVLDARNEDTHLLDPGPYFRARGGEFWVIEDQRTIRATAGVLLHEDAAELKALYVHRSLRRQGWGRRLTELAIEYTLRSGRRRMILWSDTRFHEAHRLYVRVGFRPFGRRDLHDSNNTTEIGFERELSGTLPAEAR